MKTLPQSRTEIGLLLSLCSRRTRVHYCSLAKRAIQSASEQGEAARTSDARRRASNVSTHLSSQSTHERVSVARFPRGMRLVSVASQCSPAHCIAFFASEERECDANKVTTPARSRSSIEGGSPSVLDCVSPIARSAIGR